MSDRIVVDPVAIQQALTAIRKQRDDINTSLQNLNREYQLLSETMKSETLAAATEYQETATRLLNQTNDAIQTLENIAQDYTNKSGEIDGQFGRATAGA